MTREDLDFIGAMNMCDEISNEAYKKISCHFEEQEQKPEWIPVDEQLPEPWESVLITFSGQHGGLTAEHAVGLGSWDGSSNGWYFEEIGGYAKRLTVEAWQPLPEAYTAEDGEEGKE